MALARSRPIRKGRFRGRLVLIGVIVVAATAAAFFARSRLMTQPPTWAEILRASSGERWTELEAKLDRWIRVYPKDARACWMLGKVRLRLERRDAAALVLSSIPESSATWTQAQSILGEMAIREHRAAVAERIYR
jgi:cytochrome c-type biogenesis protein CcmH/NrfG